MGKSWASPPFIAIAFGRTGNYAYLEGLPQYPPADVLRCFYGQPCWALFIHIGLASSFRHSPQQLCVFNFQYLYVIYSYVFYIRYIRIKENMETWRARSMLPLPNHGCFHGWTVTIAEAQGDKSGSDEAWEHWMEGRKCGHLQTQNSDVLKELWKRRRSKGKLWFTSGFEGTLMDIKCYERLILLTIWMFMVWGSKMKRPNWTVCITQRFQTRVFLIWPHLPRVRSPCQSFEKMRLDGSKFVCLGMGSRH